MIVLVRHGETAGNASRVVQFPETPLSERGVAQAERLGARLAALGIERILVSDYDRARMTADPIARESGVPLELEPLLRERHFGELRGMAYDDIGFDPFAQGYEPPGGESWEVFRARVARAWERVAEAAAETDGNLAVVTHGLVRQVVADTPVTLPDGTTWNGGFRNTSVSVIEPAAPHRVSLFNCTAHLDAATAHDERTRSGV